MSVLLEHIRQGVSSLKSHKLRAVITASIIAIGITALVGILTSIDAMGNAITKTMTRFGARSFTITNTISVSQYGKRNSFEDLTYTQATQFRNLFDNSATVSFAINAGFNSRLRFNSAETNPNIRVLGVDDNYLSVSSFELSGGRNFTPEDIHLGMPWVILGSDVLLQLFGPSRTDGYSIGKEVSIDGVPFRVIGELAKKGSSFGMSGGDRQVFIGIQKARQVFANAQNNITITVLSQKVEQLDADMIQAEIALRRVRRLRAFDPPNFNMTRSDALANDVKQQLSMVSGVGVLIGIITLLGAAVSLMNIMLVSVTERTKEIGLRKSLGATSIGIRNQFLVEALVICQIGGIAGIILGISLGNIVGYFLGSGFIAPWFWIFVALIVSIVVGLVAGIYPANKAAKLNPIDALRHDG